MHSSTRSMRHRGRGAAHTSRLAVVSAVVSCSSRETPRRRGAGLWCLCGCRGVPGGEQCARSAWRRSRLCGNERGTAPWKVGRNEPHRDGCARDNSGDNSRLAAKRVCTVVPRKPINISFSETGNLLTSGGTLLSRVRLPGAAAHRGAGHQGPPLARDRRCERSGRTFCVAFFLSLS